MTVAVAMMSTGGHVERNPQQQSSRSLELALRYRFGGRLQQLSPSGNEKLEKLCYRPYRMELPTIVAGLGTRPCQHSTSLLVRRE